MILSMDEKSIAFWHRAIKTLLGDNELFRVDGFAYPTLPVITRGIVLRATSAIRFGEARNGHSLLGIEDNTGLVFLGNLKIDVANFSLHGVVAGSIHRRHWVSWAPVAVDHFARCAFRDIENERRSSLDAHSFPN